MTGDGVGIGGKSPTWTLPRTHASLQAMAEQILRSVMQIRRSEAAINIAGVLTHAFRSSTHEVDPVVTKTAPLCPT